jgi:hypothetical protein
MKKKATRTTTKRERERERGRVSEESNIPLIPFFCFAPHISRSRMLYDQGVVAVL